MNYTRDEKISVLQADVICRMEIVKNYTRDEKISLRNYVLQADVLVKSTDSEKELVLSNLIMSHKRITREMRCEIIMKRRWEN